LLLKGELVRIEDAPGHSALSGPHSALTVVQDRIKPAPASRARFVEACEQAYHFGKGRLTVFEIQSPASIRNPQPFSNRLHCAPCDIEYPDPSPALFSFNHPLGACPTCKGFGRTITIDYDLAVPDRSLTLAGGAVKPWRTGTGAEAQSLADQMSGMLLAFARQGDPNHAGFPHWSPYTLEQRETMVFDLVARLENDPRGGERKLYQRAPFIQRGTM
jgi:excinuclease UvrABC ATPase subunit